MKAHHKTQLAGLLLVLFSVTTVVGQAPPAPPTPTIWSFLGIPQGCKKIHGVLFNRRGNLPGLEKKPPLKPIAAEEFLESKWDVLKEAAEVKQAEDLAPQKIKAIKYLTKIGCGCYDKEDKISKALEAAMGDCTESVRLTTVEAITEAAEGECCSNCGKVCCCNEIVLKKLAELAYDRDDSGCPKEPSARVREAAAAALEVCCPGEGPVEEVVDPVNGGPENGGGAEDVPTEATPPSGAEAYHPQPKPFPITRSKGKSTKPAVVHVRSSRLPSPPLASPAPNVQVVPKQAKSRSTKSAPVLRSVKRTAPKASSSVVKLAKDWQAPIAVRGVAEPQHGTIRHIDGRRGKAHVHFGNKRKIPVGTDLHVYKTVNRQQKLVAIVRVSETFEGSANVTKVNGNFRLVSQGDTVKIAESPVKSKKRPQKVASARTVQFRTVGLPLFGKKK